MVKTATDQHSTQDKYKQHLSDSLKLLERVEPFLWIEQNLKIRNKQKRLVNLLFNEPQIILYRHYRRAIEEGRPGRYIIPKARQFGISTEIEGLCFEGVYRQEGMNAAVIAHKEPATQNIFRMVRRFHLNLPEPIRETESSSKGEIVYAPPHDSRIQCMTAASGDDLAKSWTLQMLHCSECASWKVNADDAYTSLSNAVLDEPGTFIWLESTCKGRDAFFYPFIIDALEGRNAYEVIFLPWYLNPVEYSMGWDQYCKIYASKSLDKGEFSLTEDEIRMREEVLDLETTEHTRYLNKYITDEQFVWRRYMIENKCKRGLDDWNRYYPTFIEDCWKTTENTWFPKKTIDWYRGHTKEPKRRCEIIWPQSASIPELVDHHNGSVHIWEMPLRDAEYTIGADPSQNIPGQDWSAAYVIKNNPLRVVAGVRTRIDPDDFAVLLYRLGALYHWALLVVESNLPEVARRLVRHLNYPARAMYYDRSLDAIQKNSSRPGFHLDLKKRPILLETLLHYFKHHMINMPDQRFVIEMEDFVYNETKDRYMAAPGRHDDCIFALGCACVVIEDYYKPRAKMEEEEVLSAAEKSIILAEARLKWEDKMTRLGKKPTGGGIILA